MTQHTKEPWIRLREAEIASVEGFIIARVVSHRDCPEDTANENIQRIVACVNACEGINPRVVPGLIKGIHGMMQALDLNKPEEDLLIDYGMLGIHNIRTVKESLSALKAMPETKESEIKTPEPTEGPFLEAGMP